MNNDLILDKINELIDLAKAEGDNNTQIVLLALRGAKTCGDDVLLATKIQEFSKDVLLPRAIERRKNFNASKN